MDGPVEALNSATNIKPIEKLRIMRELSKLYSSKGQSAAAVDLLSASVVNYCQSQQGARTAGPLKSGSELASRSLLTMVKWMQGDSLLMQTIWSSEFETNQRLRRLLTNEFECRKARMGLYAGANSTESSELFKPDDSVARFDKHEYAIGQLLHLATIHCPDLAKGWWSLAGWCYRIGRKNLEALRYDSVLTQAIIILYVCTHVPMRHTKLWLIADVYKFIHMHSIVHWEYGKLVIA